MKDLNVLSLFDGMSCGMIALRRLGLPVGRYFASEIDKYAIQVSQDNWLEIEHIGSVVDVSAHKLPVKIDLLIGGSPCQGFSFAGKQLNFEDERSKLFFEFVRIWEEVRAINPDAKFLLENVKMKKEHQDVISKYMGVEPILINSSLVSAQNRKRLYWFGQSRERLFFNDYYCYICLKKENEQKGQQRILGQAQSERGEKVLGQTQDRQNDLQSLSKDLSEDRKTGDNKNMLSDLSGLKQEDFRQKQVQGEEKSLPKRVSKKELGKTFGLSETIQTDSKGEGAFNTDGTESVKKNSENHEGVFTSSIWTEEKAIERGVDYYSKYGEDLCCVQCGQKLDYRPHHPIITYGDKRPEQFTSPMSKMQFDEARQNNGRVFDTYKIEIAQPEDKGVMLKDIVHEFVDLDFIKDAEFIENQNFNPSETNGCITLNPKKLDGSQTYQHDRIYSEDGKMASICAEMGGRFIVHQQLEKYIVPFDKTLKILEKEVERGKVGYFRQDSQANRVYYIHDKAVTLCGDAGGGAAKMGQYLFGCITPDRVEKRQNGQRFSEGTKFYTLTAQDQHGILIEGYIRKLTPIECERLQTIPENYSACVSNAQRYKMCGNGWNVDTICHILQNLGPL